MTNKQFKIYLKKNGACVEGFRWVGNKTLAQAWKTFDRSDWMFWLIRKSGKVSQSKLVLVACACAYSLLPDYERLYPGDDRPRKAIEAAERWAKEPTKKNKDAAYAVANAAYAAHTAVNAVANAASAVYAANAATLSECSTTEEFNALLPKAKETNNKSISAMMAEAAKKAGLKFDKAKGVFE